MRPGGGHNAFGPPGCPRGVVDGQQTTFAGLALYRAGRLREQLFVLVVGSSCHDQPNTHCSGDFRSNVGELGCCHKDPRSTVVEDVLDLGRREANVEGHQNRTVQRDGTVQFEHHVAVGTQSRHPVALTDPQVFEHAGEGKRASVVVGVSESEIAVDDGGSVREGLRRTRQKCRRGQWGEGEVARIGVGCSCCWHRHSSLVQIAILQSYAPRLVAFTPKG